MIVIRTPQSIFKAGGAIDNGAFSGRWHFSFDEYYDPKYVRFGNLRVFNDDTLSPGATWPLHHHAEIEVVTYCAEGEFLHVDERGKGGVLQKGWVQHTTVGQGMSHSEVNNRPDIPLRFIQMWFMPKARRLKPSVEQKKVTQEERTNKFLPLVSNTHPEALKIASDASVYSAFLKAGRSIKHPISKNKGGYLYLLEGGAIKIANHKVNPLGAAMITGETGINISAESDSELLLVEVTLD
ncbi:MAG: pirin family protein [Planctomycetes bacterium]|nr:pirin family protein [Planctomycetota bacterium]